MDIFQKRTELGRFIGKRVRVSHAVVGRGSTYIHKNRVLPSTLLYFVRVRELGDRQVTVHTWLNDRNLISDGCALPGDVVAFDADVYTYESYDRTRGRHVTRYAFCDASNVTVLGPVTLAGAVREMMKFWSWDEIADAVAAAQPEDADGKDQD